jgi:hypothetical protein
MRERLLRRRSRSHGAFLRRGALGSDGFLCAPRNARAASVAPPRQR